MTVNKLVVHYVNLYDRKESKLQDFLKELSKYPSNQIEQWMDNFTSSDIMVLTGKEFSYAVNFSHKNELGCTFIIKGIDSTDLGSCVVGSCEEKVGLTAYYLFSKSVAIASTPVTDENSEDMEKLKEDTERNISQVLSFSVMSEKEKLDTLIDALEPMIPDEIKAEFEALK